MSYEEQRKRAEFAERVRIRLAALNKTQADLAREHGISQQAFGQNLSRAPYVTFAILERIASMLEVEVDWLVGGDPREGVPESRQPVLEPLDVEESV